MKHSLRVVTAFCVLQCASPVWAWGAEIHRSLAAVALERLTGAGDSEWLKRAGIVERVLFNSNQPDRWRGWPSDILKHENDADHYLDAELLAQFGLTLETMPRLRNEYLRAMAVAKHTHPEQVDPYDAGKDPARTQEWPGFLLHAIAEHYAKLQAAFNQVQILEHLDDPKRTAQLAEARGVAVYHIGALAHFVADAAQPLHTTKHFNGWVGENPRGFKWRDRFHNYVDEGWAQRHGIRPDAIRAAARDVKLANPRDPWDDVRNYFERSHAELERLYALERDGELDGEPGRKLLLERLGDAAGMLSALIQAAYDSSLPTVEQVERWTFYDNDGQKPEPTTQPASAPAVRPESQPATRPAKRPHP